MRSPTPALQLISILIGAISCGPVLADKSYGEIDTENGRYRLEERIIEGLAKSQDHDPSYAERYFQRNAQGDLNQPALHVKAPAGAGAGSPLDPHRPPAGAPPPYEIDIDYGEEFANPADQSVQDRSNKEKRPSVVVRKGQAEQPFPPPMPDAHALKAQDASKRATGVAQVAAGVGDTVFIGVVTVCSALAAVALVGAGFYWRRLHRQYKAAEESEYPQYGVTGPVKDRQSPGDAKLASSAHLYHYQHTKQQIIAMEQSHCDAKGQESEDSEGEGDEGDYSVYECPGLAPTGDIEVSNPLFDNSGTVAATHGSTTAESGPATGKRAEE